MMVARQAFMVFKENVFLVIACHSSMFTHFPSDFLHDFLEGIVPAESPLFEEIDI